MALITGIVLPNEGDRIKAADHNIPIQKIITEVNGNLDDSNIASVSGSKITAGSITKDKLATDVADGWSTLGSALAITTSDGQRQFTVTATGVDLTSKLSPGTKLKIPRTTTAPTQCYDFESGSSQYADKSSPSGITFTDDFTIEAWVKLESYVAGGLVSRYNGTSGFLMYTLATGQVTLQGNNAGAGNYKFIQSYPSLPLGRWVHVAATLDMSGGVGTMYFDGVAVPALFSSAGTNPTAIVQAGNLQLAAYNSTNPQDAELSDVRIWNVVRSAANIRDNQFKQLLGNESNLVGYWKLAGNLTDSTANANNFTGINTPVVATDNPFNATEYAIVTKAVFSTNTVLTLFTGQNGGVPNETLGTVSFSAARAPYGFPAERGKWEIQGIWKIIIAQAPVALTWYNNLSAQLQVPIGTWDVGYAGNLFGETASAMSGILSSNISLTAASAATIGRLGSISYGSFAGAGTSGLITRHIADDSYTQTTFVPLYVNVMSSAAGSHVDWFTPAGSNNPTLIMYARCAYI